MISEKLRSEELSFPLSETSCVFCMYLFNKHKLVWKQDKSHTVVIQWRSNSLIKSRLYTTTAQRCIHVSFVILILINKIRHKSSRNFRSVLRTANLGNYFFYPQLLFNERFYHYRRLERACLIFPTKPHRILLLTEPRTMPSLCVKFIQDLTVDCFRYPLRNWHDSNFPQA